jgi:superfamily II DNA or RNA helicase
MKTKDQIQKEALGVLKRVNKGGIEVSMGVGKTLLGLKHMAVNYTDISKFLVVAPKIKIFLSWKDEMLKFKYEHLEEHVTFTTYRSLVKQDLDYDVIYLDECHSLKDSHASWLQEYEAKGGIIIGLTGTYPTRKGTEKWKMCTTYCPKLYEYKTDDAVNDKILNDYRIFIHQLTLDDKQTIEKDGKFGQYYTSEVKEYNYWTNRLESARPGKDEQICRIQRMKSIQMFPSKEAYAQKLFYKQKDKTIVFANTQAQADSLCEYSVHSKNKKSDEYLQMFKDGFITKLSAVEQLSEGVTIPELRVGIIMHAYGNNRKTSQKIGRLLRLNPDDTAEIHILCYSKTVDEKWVESALSHLDQNKIKWIQPYAI